MKRQVIFGTLFSVACSACSFIPEYTRPKLPVEDNWRQAPPIPEGEGAASLRDIGWRSFFQSPALQQVIEITLENNRDLRIAALRIEQARALYRIERSDLFPSIAVGGDAQRQDLPDALGSSALQTSRYNANVRVTAFELDVFGRIRSENQAAVEEYLATEEAYRAVTISLIAEAANAYLRFLADKRLFLLAEETLSAQEKTLKLVNQSFLNGAASRLDVAQVRQTVERARAERARFKRFLEQDRNALVVLMGRNDEKLFSSPPALRDIEVLETLPVGLPSEVLLMRPDVRAAEHLLRAENARIGAARSAFFPRFSLTGSYGFAAADLSDLFRSSAEGAWSFAPVITMPIFEGGRNIANLDLAHVRKNSAIAQYEQSIQVAFREVADELAALQTLTEQLEAQRSLVAASQEAYDLSFARYNSGVDNFLTVLDAQRSLFFAQQEAIDVYRQRLANLVNLYKVLGGGIDAVNSSAS